LYHYLLAIAIHVVSCRVALRGVSPFKNNFPLSFTKERGIKGVRLPLTH
jgi:hypothetical protein